MRNKYALKLSAPDSDIVRCFDAAIRNAVKINTVKCKYKQYNQTGLLRYPYMIRAGRNYKTPWTRDASVNTWQAMNFIEPEVSRTTLFAVCGLNESGQPIIQPDVQTWDQIVWAIGAYNYYLSTGDEEFIRIAHGIIGRALEAHRKNRFNESFSLFVGGSFFNDGIAGYPLPCHQQGNNNSFAPAHPVVETIMCLSTNCLYCEAYRIYAEISAHLGLTSEEETAKIMDFFALAEKEAEILSTVNTENVERMVYVMPMTNIIREDIAKKLFTRDQLQEQAPEAMDGYWQVPRLVD